MVELSDQEGHLVAAHAEHTIKELAEDLNRMTLGAEVRVTYDPTACYAQGASSAECVEVRFHVGPVSAKGRATEAEWRTALYEEAENVISAVEAQGWRHSRAPRIVLDGSAAWVSGGRLKVVPDCEVRLEVYRPSVRATFTEKEGARWLG